MKMFPKISFLKVFSFVAGAISGLLGVIGFLGFCSASWMVSLFALAGINSMFLMSYSWLFSILAAAFFGFGALIYFKTKGNYKCQRRKMREERTSKTILPASFTVKMILAVLLALVIFTGYLRFKAEDKKRLSLRSSDLVGKITELEEMAENNDPQLREEIKALRKDIEKSNVAESYSELKKIKDEVTPLGIPDLYGEELGVSFDRVQEAIDTVSPFDPTYGLPEKKIKLTGDNQKRYIKIGSAIACEYCCGAKTLVFANGEAACGCAHSQMMRGLAAYLIKTQPQLTDGEILEELEKWKAAFFPKETLAVKIRTLEKTGDEGVKRLLQESPELLPEMVGGC